jgi:hypothetical protein
MVACRLLRPMQAQLTQMFTQLNRVEEFGVAR